ncbi:MAG: glycosyltransferase family A protein [bacterium]
MTPRLVSIILPVFNGEAHLREALQAALGQTYPNIEVIVVDDGSNDRSAAIVNELARQDHRIRMVSQSNKGVAAARNTAIANAKGDFIAPLDADDIWDRRKIELQMAQMAPAGRSVPGFVYCWWAWIGLHGDVLDVSPSWEIEGHVVEQLLEVNFTGNASVPLFRRDCIEEVGGYSTRLREQGGEGCEDWDLAIRIAERYEVAVVPKVLVAYRRRADGMSNAPDRMQRSQVLLIEGLRARQPELADRVEQRSRAQLALHLAGVSFWSGNYARAIRSGVTALRSGVGFEVLPFLPRIFLRKLLKNHAPPNVCIADGDFSACEFPHALIPYDRIYARRHAGFMPRGRKRGS